MPRSLSTAARQAIFSPQTGEVFVLLLTLSHPDWAEPIRVNAAGAQVVSSGRTFEAYPFRISLPSESEDAPRPVTLEIDNVDRRIVEAVRSVSDGVTASLELVLASSPDTIEAGPFDFDLAQTRYDASTVSSDLVYLDVLNEPFPADTFNPSTFPGLFQ